MVLKKKRFVFALKSQYFSLLFSRGDERPLLHRGRGQEGRVGEEAPGDELQGALYAAREEPAGQRRTMDGRC